MLILFTDSDTDVTSAQAKELNCRLISMPYELDGKTVYPYVDFDKFDAHAFYDTLRSGKMSKTFGLSPENYKEYFEPEFEKGNDILYVHFSKAMTGTFDAMRLAIEELKEKYPDRKFYDIDTKGITICSYNIVQEIAKMYNAGRTAEDILKWADTEVDKFATYFYADDLKFFGRSGRISNFSALMGGLLGIHPIICMGSDGKMTSISKARGRKASLNKLVDYVAELQDDIYAHKVVIGHADCIDIAKTLGGMLQQRFADKLDIEYVEVNPTAGSHCGPDTVGVSFHAKHR